MAKKSTRRYSPKKKTYRRKSTNSPTKALIGGLMYAVAEPMIDTFTSRIPLGTMGSDEIIKAAVGYLAAKRGGIIGDVGRAMLYVNAYKLAQGKFNLMGAVPVNSQIENF